MKASIVNRHPLLTFQLTIALCASLVMLPVQEQQKPKAGAGPLCIGIGLVAVACGVYVIIRSCRPRWRCVWDSEQEKPLHRWATTMTRKAIEASGFKIAGCVDGYPTEAACKRYCCDDPVPPDCIPAASFDSETIQNFSIQSSSNLVDWVVEETFTGLEGDIEFQREYQDAARFFRVMLVP
jgi:hypothetical protein